MKSFFFLVQHSCENYAKHDEKEEMLREGLKYDILDDFWWDNVPEDLYASFIRFAGVFSYSSSSEKS